MPVVAYLHEMYFIAHGGAHLVDDSIATALIRIHCGVHHLGELECIHDRSVIAQILDAHARPSSQDEGSVHSEILSF